MVDDEPAICVLIGLVLADAGFEVDVARDGIEVCRVVEQAVPDAIVLDLRMPRMDGRRFVRECLGTIPKPPPVLLICASDGRQAASARTARLTARG